MSPTAAIELDRVGDGFFGHVHRHAAESDARAARLLNGADGPPHAPRRCRDRGRARRRCRAGSAQGDEIVRTFECASFPDAIAFVVRIGFFAERADHHPDLDVRWRKVRAALTTHDAGGLTALDLDLAAEISRRVHGTGAGLTCRSRSRSASSWCCSFVFWSRSRKEPGPGPADVAIAYERAWDELDFGLLCDLSGDELRDGLRRDQFVAREARGVRERGEPRAGSAPSIEVDDVVSTQQTAVVATRVTTDEGMRAQRVCSRSAPTVGWSSGTRSEHDVSRLPALACSDRAARAGGMGTDKATIVWQRRDARGACGARARARCATR